MEFHFVENRVIKTIADMFGAKRSEINLNDNFFDKLHLDSLDGIELIMSLEEEFEIEVNEEVDKSIYTLRTPQQIIDYLRKL